MRSLRGALVVLLGLSACGGSAAAPDDDRPGEESDGRPSDGGSIGIAGGDPAGPGEPTKDVGPVATKDGGVPGKADGPGSSGGPGDASTAKDAPPAVSGRDAPPATGGACQVPTGTTWWRPRKGLTWEWQLMAPFSTDVAVEVMDIDLFDAPKATIQTLHDRGRKVVCYVNVGAWEDWRDDAAQFPKSLLGKTWSEDKFTNERWLDIRRIDLLQPILGARFDLAKAKGCDAIEPDNIDGWSDGGTGKDRTGFKLTAQDQLAFNRWIACESHRRGMAVALKNDPVQAKDLVNDFDFVVSESCFTYDECGYFKPFLDMNKAVLETEYRDEIGYDKSPAKFNQVCAQAKAQGISTILKTGDLDTWRKTCP